MILPQIKFVFDRKHRASDKEKGSIELRITFERKQKFVTTGVKCFPGQWDASRECIKSLSSLEDNANLLQIRKRVLKIIGDMADSENIDINAIPTLLKQKAVDITFEDYIYKRMKEKQVGDYTKKAYNTFYSRYTFAHPYDSAAGFEYGRRIRGN